MQVRDLIEKLQRVDPAAHVVVGGEIIHGVELRKGWVIVGYYNPQFSFHPKGKDTALVFVGNTELSTGEVVPAMR